MTPPGNRLKATIINRPPLSPQNATRTHFSKRAQTGSATHCCNTNTIIATPSMPNTPIMAAWP